MEYCVSGCFAQCPAWRCVRVVPLRFILMLCGLPSVRTPHSSFTGLLQTDLGISSRGRDTSGVLVDVCQSCRWELSKKLSS